jgi:nuclear transport factor 2 (NTF2) superfamily protein
MIEPEEAESVAESTTDTFQSFKHELGQKVKVAKAAGMSQQDIQQHAQEIGDFLSSHYDPRSPEQRLLKELWSVSDRNEQQSIANAVVKLVQH